jgi:hypothetical protein
VRGVHAIDSVLSTLVVALSEQRGRTSMNVSEPSKPADQSHAAPSSDLEGQIGEVVRRDVAAARKPQDEGGNENGLGTANALLRQIAGATFKEIDRLIDELQAMRDLLQGEGQRVQREIVKYAQLSQAAMKSTKVIAEGMTQMQNGAAATAHKGW